jgi:chaperonin GroES
MKFRPLHDRVVVRRITPQEKSSGGIIIPDTVQEKPMEGEIVAAGPGARNEQGSIVALQSDCGGPRAVWQMVGDRGQARR